MGAVLDAATAGPVQLCKEENPMLSVNRVTFDTRAVISQIGRLRVRSWANSRAVPGFLPESDCWLDEHDQHAALWTASVDGTIVASARLCVHERIDELPDAAYFRGLERHFPGPVALLSRLVVAPEARGLGLPGILDSLRLTEARQCHAKSVAAITHVPSRLNALQHLGFEIIGEAARRTVCDQPSMVGVLRNCSGSPTDAAGECTAELRGPPPKGWEHEGICPTLNGMGWCSQIPSIINTAFSDAAANCRFPVLDIGAGHGLASLSALRNGASVVVNDVSPGHLGPFVLQATAENLTDFSLAIGRVPNDIDFGCDRFDAIHASNILHFLTPSELKDAVAAMWTWLRPQGLAFVQVCSPYVGNFKKFIPVYEARLEAEDPAPGFMENVVEFASEETIHRLSSHLNLMTKYELANIFEAAGFVVEDSFEYRRDGLPEQFHYDGRENVGLIARKRGPCHA